MMLRNKNFPKISFKNLKSKVNKSQHMQLTISLPFSKINFTLKINNNNKQSTFVYLNELAKDVQQSYLFSLKP